MEKGGTTSVPVGSKIDDKALQVAHDPAISQLLQAWPMIPVDIRKQIMALIPESMPDQNS